MNTPHPPSQAPAEIVPARKGLRFSWTWVFPLLAVAVTAWLFWQKEQAKGPLIQIAFSEAPGIEPGKSHLTYRGVKAGEVIDLQIDHKLGKVVAKVQLMAFAEGLARKGTEFWIEKPEVSLHGISGLEALIQGNSIRALVTDANGPRADSFVALSEPPLSLENAPTLSLSLEAESIPFISRGTPVFHRGTQIGWIRDKELSNAGRAVARVVIREEYVGVVRENSRFWLLSAASLGASPGQVQLNLPSISSLLDGGVAVDHFETPGPPAKENQVFELSANEVAARADGPRLTIEFHSGFALRSGETRVFYLGQPIGIVEKVETIVERARLRAHVRLSKEAEPLVTSSARFSFVRPAITWKGITGLEALVVGPYISIDPGAGGGPQTDFVALTPGEVEQSELAAQFSGVQVTVRAGRIPQLEPGTPVYYEGMQVGAVLEKMPAPEGGLDLRLGFRPEHRDLVRKSSRFWRLPATKATVGPGQLEVSLEGLASLIYGGLAFADFSEPGEPAESNDIFPLFSSAELAAATSPPVKIRFSDGRGLLAGQTQLRYLGLPVGLVDAVEITPTHVIATARFIEGFDFLRKKGSQFAIVRPEISLQAVSGLEALVSGVYISCVAGDGTSYVSEFSGAGTQDEKLVATPGFEIRLSTPSTQISPGAPVLYNDMPVGEITEKKLADSGNEILLTAVIFPDYKKFVRSNSVFWDATRVRAKVGFFQVEIDAPTLVDPHGKVAFFTAEKGGEPVRQNTLFPLADKPPRLPR